MVYTVQLMVSIRRCAACAKASSIPLGRAFLNADIAHALHARDSMKQPIIIGARVVGSSLSSAASSSR